VAAFKADVEAAADLETASTQLNATLDSTGRQSEITVAGLDKMAASPLWDTAQIDQAANALARFMDIPSNQMGPDLVIIENMAAGLGESLPAAAQTFGQAMETGRTRGLGFSRELTNQISLLMTAGNIQQADAIILDQLSQKYSGQAAAALDTYNGKVQSLKSAWEDEKAASGQAFITNETINNGMGTLTQSIETSTDRLNLLNQARALGIDALVHEGTATVQVNGKVMTYDQLLTTVTNQEQEFSDVTQQHTSHLAEFASGMADAATVTDIFTGAQLDATTASKQEADELNFITGFAKQYETNLTKVSDAEQKLSADEATLASLQKAGWGNASTKIKDATKAVQDDQDALNKAKEASKDATNEMIAGFLQAQLSADGVFDSKDVQKVLDYRLQVGLLTMDEYNAAMQALAIADNLAGIQDKTVTLTIVENRSINEKVNRIDNPPPSSTGLPPPGSGGMAVGGPVAANSYLFNEDPSTRPETFVSGGGYMLTKQDAQAAITGSGVQVHVHYSPLMSLGTQAELERNLAPVIDKALKQAGLKR
jgi:hypothetical protein